MVILKTSIHELVGSTGAFAGREKPLIYVIYEKLRAKNLELS